jgi:hypothetical protein
MHIGKIPANKGYVNNQGVVLTDLLDFSRLAGLCAALSAVLCPFAAAISQ